MTNYKADIMKNRLTALCVCTLMAILSMAIYGISDKYYELSAPVVVTLSSEQLEGADHTDAEKCDDRDLWEDGDETYSYSFSQADTETVSVINFPIDINIATAEELTNIKGIGISAAEKIISYRENNGYFHSVDELLNVDGIGEKTLDKMRKFIYVSAEFEEITTISPDVSEEISETASAITFPIDINIATAEELINIKGIGISTAEKIISYRENNGYFHSVDELINVSGIGEKKLKNIRKYVYISPEFTVETIETTIADEEITETALTDNIKSIELNSATKEELMQINGVGEVTADAIVEYAQTVGFSEVSDLLNVKGIGEKKLEKIAPYVYVEK